MKLSVCRSVLLVQSFCLQVFSFSCGGFNSESAEATVDNTQNITAHDHAAATTTFLQLFRW